MKSDFSGLQLLVEWRDTQSLRPDPRNSKIHSGAQIKQVCASIVEFGWTNPILIDESNSVLAGHARLLAAKELGLAEVPTIKLSHMSPAQKRAYLIGDNKLAENAKWDRKMLALEYEAIQLLDPEFNLTLTGFKMDEIQIFFDNELPSRQDRIPEPDTKQPPISQIGDKWILGDHRLFCGDAREIMHFGLLMGDDQAQLVLCDPPYNVRIAKNVTTNERHDEFVMASGEMSPAEFTAFLKQAISNLVLFSCNGSIHFIFMDWRHLREVQDAAAAYTEQKNLICWDKGTAGLGTFYRSQHELVFAFKNGSKPHVNNFKLGENGRHRSNVWSYPGLNGWGPGRKAQLSLHPTPKPVPLLADAMKDCSNVGGLVLDCFGGSGSTLIAAQQTGRRARLIELDPRYVDVTIRRFQAETIQEAFLCDDGRSFNDIEKHGR